MNDNRDILMMMWGWAAAGGAVPFASADGPEVLIVYAGEVDHEECAYRNAELTVDGRTVHGDVVFGRCFAGRGRHAALHVVDSRCEPLLRANGERVVQLVVEIPEGLKRRVDSLRSDPMRDECRAWLAGAKPQVRTFALDALAVERLKRKAGDVADALREAEGDWSQAFHVMLFRAMGGNRNREPYMELARRATYQMVLRERSSVTMVEALLLGTSGLLEGCYFDDYINELREHYDYLAGKYRIRPMMPGEWDRRGTHPVGNIVLRIVQAASLLASRDFILDTLLHCRTRDDVQKLFGAEASDYWTTHYVPDGKSSRFPKRIGTTKADLLGMNLVAPMMYAYGERNAKPEMVEAAIDILTRIPPESNTIINGWTGAGVPLANAADSQAIMQLNNDYCEKSRCTDCRVGKSIINSVITR